MLMYIVTFNPLAVVTNGHVTGKKTMSRDVIKMCRYYLRQSEIFVNFEDNFMFGGCLFVQFLKIMEV